MIEKTQSLGVLLAVTLLFPVIWAMTTRPRTATGAEDTPTIH